MAKEQSSGVRVRVEPLGIVLGPGESETIIDAAWREGYHWPTICQGEGRCGQCHFVVQAGGENLLPAGEAERAVVRWLERVGVQGPLRLACRAIATGDITAFQPGVRKV